MTHTAINWPADDLQDWSFAAEEFAQRRMTGTARDHDHHADECFPSLLADLQHMGFLDLCADERIDGGLGQQAGSLARVLEPLCAVDASAGAAVYASAVCHLALRASQVPDRWLQAHPGLACNWLAWPAFHDINEQTWPALDVSGMLSGQVEMLLLGAHSRWAVLPARRTDSSLSLVLVELAHATVDRSHPIRTLGLSACGLVDARFQKTPCDELPGNATELLRQLEPSLAAAVIAMQCGVMRGSLHMAQQYVAERYQGGGNLLGWGEVRRLLSLMHERLNVASGALGQALYQMQHQTTNNGDLSAAYGALHVGDLACLLTTDGVQLLGGNGYMKDYGQEKRMRDARQLQGLLGGVAWRRQRLISRALLC